MPEELSVLESEISCDTCAYMGVYHHNANPAFREIYCMKEHKTMDANLCGDYLYKDKLYGNR